MLNKCTARSCIITLVILSILLTQVASQYVQCPGLTSSCDLYITSKTGAYQKNGPLELNLDPWHEVHVQAGGIITSYKNTPEYTLPEDSCSSHEYLAILGKCGWWSVLASSLLTGTLALFVFSTWQAYKKST